MQNVSLLYSFKRTKMQHLCIAFNIIVRYALDIIEGLKIFYYGFT